jgi:hypothetical protein
MGNGVPLRKNPTSQLKRTSGETGQGGDKGPRPFPSQMALRNELETHKSTTALLDLPPG